MSYAKQMLDSYPKDYNVDTDLLVACIEACFDCAQACTACADDCLSEDNVADMIKCIRLDSDCADICVTTGRILSRQTEYDANVTRSALEACAQSARPAATSANATARWAWSTAESAPKPAASANRPATNCWPRSGDNAPQGRPVTRRTGGSPPYDTPPRELRQRRRMARQS